MANSSAIAMTGRSLVRLLDVSFTQHPPVEGRNTRAVLVRTDDFAENARTEAIGSPALSVFLYRIDFNKTMRAAWSAVGHTAGRAHLALDLHYLITPWAENAEFEQLILGQAMQCLETTPILGGPLLQSLGDWAPNECLQVVLEEVPTEAVMRTFDSLPTDYRLSVPYIARVLRIDSREAHPDAPVTTVVAGVSPSVTA